MKRLALTSFAELQQHMKAVLPKLDIACSYSIGRYTSKDILKYIEADYMQIWLAFNGDELDGFILTQIIDYPQAKSLRFICLMGVGVEGWQEFIRVIDGWLPFTRQIEEWGLSMGCSLSQIECPAAWDLYLRNFGYSRGHVLLDKELK